MAITASTFVFPSIVTNGQRVDVVLTVSNSGGSNVSVRSIQSQINNGYASASRNIALSVGQSAVVPAGGSASFSWSDVFFGNLQSISPEFNFSVGALVYTDDGSYTSATSASVEVVPPQTITPAQVTSFTPAAGPLPTTIYATAPLQGAPPYLPVVGQLRFESSMASGLGAALCM